MKMQRTWPLDYLTTTRNGLITVNEYYCGTKCQLIENKIDDPYYAQTLVAELRSKANKQLNVVDCRQKIIEDEYESMPNMIATVNDVYAYSTCFRDCFTGSTPNGDYNMVEYHLVKVGFKQDRVRRLSHSLGAEVKATFSTDKVFVAIGRKESNWFVHLYHY